jgi:hypothetical protein
MGQPFVQPSRPNRIPYAPMLGHFCEYRLALANLDGVSRALANADFACYATFCVDYMQLFLLTFYRVDRTYFLANSASITLVCNKSLTLSWFTPYAFLRTHHNTNAAFRASFVVYDGEIIPNGYGIEWA